MPPTLRPACCALLIAMGVLVQLLLPSQAWAAPVNWQDVPITAEGQQWWDAGSLRINRSGHLTVLSRYQPAEVEGRRPPGHLVVMEIDCDRAAFRDTSVDGLPQLGATWRPADQESLTRAVVDAACAAALATPLPQALS